MREQTHQLRLMQARLLSEHWRKQAETAETSVATLTARCEALEQEKAQMLTALRKVPLFSLTKDALGWRCAGCGSVSGIHRDGRTRDEACMRDCYVPVVEAAINRAEGK